MEIMQNLHLQDLQLFMLVADTGSMNKTAELQLLDQSSISRKLKHLEAIFACRLLIRSGKGVNLTANGQLLYDFSQKFFNSFMNLKANLKNELSIGTYESIATYKFPKYFSKATKFIIANDPNQLLKAFKQGKINTLIVDDTIAAQLSANLFKKNLFREPYYLVSRIPFSKHQDLIVYPRACPINQKIRSNFKFIPQLQETDFSSSLIEMVKRSRKATVLPETIVKTLSGFHLKKLASSFDRHIVYLSRTNIMPSLFNENYG